MGRRPCHGDARAGQGAGGNRFHEIPGRLLGDLTGEVTLTRFRSVHVRRSPGAAYRVLLPLVSIATSAESSAPTVTGFTLTKLAGGHLVGILSFRDHLRRCRGRSAFPSGGRLRRKSASIPHQVRPSAWRRGDALDSPMYSAPPVITSVLSCSSPPLLSGWFAPPTAVAEFNEPERPNSKIGRSGVGYLPDVPEVGRSRFRGGPEKASMVSWHRCDSFFVAALSVFGSPFFAVLLLVPAIILAFAFPGRSGSGRGTGPEFREPGPPDLRASQQN